jgi:hypothetical protein
MKDLSRRTAALVLTAAAACAPAAAARAATTPRGDFRLEFGVHKPGKPTTLHLHLRYKGPDPAGKPSPIRHIVMRAPEGTRFDSTALPRCTASDEELRADGDSACPPGSHLGGGRLTAITGFGPPVDPFATDVSIYNADRSFVEIVKDHTSGRPLATDRFQIRGSTWIGNPPATPGGPPDGQTAVRDVDFDYTPKAAWATTPARCGPSRRWPTSATFTYADGVTTTIHDSIACTPRKRRGGGGNPPPADGWTPTAAPRSAAPRD